MSDDDSEGFVEEDQREWALYGEFFIVESWSHNPPGGGDGQPIKNGWPVCQTWYNVASLVNDNRVHTFLCYALDKESDDFLQGQTIPPNTLLEMAKWLKRFATKAVPKEDYEDQCDDVFDEQTPGTEAYYRDRERRMAEAPALAKKIRKAGKYIKKQNKGRLPGDPSRPFTYAVYIGSWPRPMDDLNLYLDRKQHRWKRRAARAKRAAAQPQEVEQEQE